MIYPIILYGDPILNRISEKISRNYPNLILLINDMYETMHKAKGIGLSAIQIGIPIKLFVIEAHLPEKNFHFKGVFINPIIEKTSGPLVINIEGCLSIPSLSGMVERPDVINMSYFNEDWVHKKEKFSGLKARIIQHEYDHLMGKVFPDRLSKIWRKTIEYPLEIIKERKIKMPYLSR